MVRTSSFDGFTDSDSFVPQPSFRASAKNFALPVDKSLPWCEYIRNDKIYVGDYQRKVGLVIETKAIKNCDKQGE